MAWHVQPFLIHDHKDNWNAKNSMNAMTLPVLVTGVYPGNRIQFNNIELTVQWKFSAIALLEFQNARAPVGQLVRAFDRNSEDPGSNPGWTSMSFFQKPCL